MTLDLWLVLMRIQSDTIIMLLTLTKMVPENINLD